MRICADMHIVVMHAVYATCLCVCVRAPLCATLLSKRLWKVSTQRKYLAFYFGCAKLKEKGHGC